MKPRKNSINVLLQLKSVFFLKQLQFYIKSRLEVTTNNFILMCNMSCRTIPHPCFSVHSEDGWFHLWPAGQSKKKVAKKKGVWLIEVFLTKQGGCDLALSVL